MLSALALLLVSPNPVLAGPHADPGPPDRYAVPYTPVTFGHALTAPLPGFAYDYAVTDWDGDGRTDLLAHVRRGGGLVFYRNVGTPDRPRFRPLRENRVLLGSHAPLGRFFAVADVNGDGRREVVGFDSQGPARNFGKVAVPLRVYFNRGTPGEPRWETVAAVHPDGTPVRSPADVKDAPTVSAADWDGDGRLDLLLGLQELDAVYPGGPHRGMNRTAGFRDPADYRPNAARVVWRRNLTEPGSPRPVFAAPRPVIADGSPITAFSHPHPEAADLDGDGRVDLVLGSHRPGPRVFRNVGTDPDTGEPVLVESGTLPGEHGRPLFSAGLVRVRAGDLDGDGVPELVGSGYFGESNRYRVLHRVPSSGYATRWREGTPLSFDAAADTPLYGYGNSTVDPVDWDGDGDTDLLLGAEPGTPGVAINVGTESDRRFLPPVRLKWVDGTPLETYPIQTGAGSHWGPGEWYTDRWSPRAADWDGDGTLDLLTGSMGRRLYLARGRRVFDTDGKRELRFEPVVNFRRGGRDLDVPDRLFPAVLDRDGDGHADLLIPDDAGRLLAYPGDGTPDLGEPTELRGDGFALRVADYWGRVKGDRTGIDVADWDVDGRRDLIVNRFHVGVFLHRGRPDGRFGPPEPLVTPLYSHLAGPSVFDWDRDGTPDLLIGGDNRRMIEPAVPGHLVVFDGRETLTPAGRQR